MTLRPILGRHPVLEALRAGRVRAILVGESAREDGTLAEILRRAREAAVDVRRAGIEELERAAAGEVHQGVVGLAEPLPDLSVEDLLERARGRGEDPFVLLLDHLEDPHNLGAVLRVADGAGAHGVVIPSRRSASLTPGALKSAAGAAEHVPVVEVGNLMEAVSKLKRAEVWVGAADVERGKPCWEERLTGPLALVLGSEGHGISHPVLKHCDFFVRIPLGGALASLNVSTAAAVLAFERRRQVLQGKGK